MASDAEARKNGVAMHRHAGLTARIKEAIAGEALSVEELCERLDAPRANVASMINQLVSQGGAVRVSGTYPPLYRGYDPLSVATPPTKGKSKAGSGVIAGRLLIRGYKS